MGDFWKKLAFISVGLCPFLTVNVVFAELSLLIQDLPEGKKVGTNISIVFAVGNILPLFYNFVLKHDRHSSKQRGWIVSLVLLILCFVALVVYALFWDVTSCFSPEHCLSVGLYFAVILSSIVGCLSIVTLYEFVQLFPAHFNTFFSFGLGISALLPALLALLQSVSFFRHHLSISLFFAFFSGIAFLGLVSFFALTRQISSGYFYRCTDDEHISNGIEHSQENKSSEQNAILDSKSTALSDSKPEMLNENTLLLSIQPKENDALIRGFSRTFTHVAHSPVLSILFSSSMYFCVIPGLFPYFVSDSSSLSQDTQSVHLVVLNLALSIGSPIGRFFPAVFLNPWPLNQLYLFTSFQAFFYSVLVALSFHKGWVFVDMHLSMFVSLCAVVFCFSLLNGYISTVVYLSVRAKQPLIGKQAVLRINRMCSVSNQMGFVAGSFLSFAIVALA
eukprot:GCRY01003067.1.p1 GENE.GCRY01003067.1~~GCRY01003067.1.p1  ORF type:complete len:447 (-),score=65.61 GCRY01003067.1:344-1684(-)